MTLCKLQFPEPESDSNSRPMDRVALGCHKGSLQATALFQAMCLLPMDLHKTIHQEERMLERHNEKR